MVPFRVMGIPADLARQARTTLKSPQYGHPAHAEMAAGYGPCRSCLATFEQGKEERLLFTYDPFAGLDPYPSPGPIFIHREECPVWDADTFPPTLRSLPLTFEGYGDNRWIVARERVADGEVEAAIERLLSNAEIRYIHVRNTEAGCFIARVERGEALREEESGIGVRLLPQAGLPSCNFAPARGSRRTPHAYAMVPFRPLPAAPCGLQQRSAPSSGPHPDVR